MENYAEKTIEDFIIYLKNFKEIFEKELYNVLKKTIKDENLRAHIFKITSSGKRIRALLCALSCQLLNGKLNNVMKLCVAIELLHNATLMHDDIIDDRFDRRGNYNKQECVVLGDTMISLGVRTSVENYGKKMTSLLAKYGFAMSYGEYMEIENSYKNIDEKRLNIDEYFERIKNKSSLLFESAAYTGAMIGNGTKKERIALKNFGRFFGISYQLVDDLKDVEEDLKNFVITLPLILLYDHLDENERKNLIEKFKNHETKEIINLMQKYNIFDACKREISIFLNKAKKEIEIFKNCEFKNHLLLLVDILENPNIYEKFILPAFKK